MTCLLDKDRAKKHGHGPQEFRSPCRKGSPAPPWESTAGIHSWLEQYQTPTQVGSRIGWGNVLLRSLKEEKALA